MLRPVSQPFYRSVMWWLIPWRRMTHTKWKMGANLLVMAVTQSTLSKNCHRIIGWVFFSNITINEMNKKNRMAFSFQLNSENWIRHWNGRLFETLSSVSETKLNEVRNRHTIKSTNSKLVQCFHGISTKTSWSARNSRCFHSKRMQNEKTSDRMRWHLFVTLCFNSLNIVLVLFDYCFGRTEK